MADNIDDILKDKAFDCISEEGKRELKHLYINMQGKTVEEALPYIMAYSGKLKSSNCSKAEKQAIIKIFMCRLSEKEKKQMNKFLKMMGL